MFSIEFNGYNSYKDLGLVVEHKPTVPSPGKNIVNIDVQGRNGTLTEDFKTYKDISISLNFGFKEKNNFEHKCRLIKYWLNNIKNRKLILSNDTEMFYKVKYVKLDNIDRSIRNLGRFAASFVCEPFCYLEEGLEPIILYPKNIIGEDKIFNIYNPGTFPSEPCIQIYGSGTMLLKINNNVAIGLKHVEENIIIDTELMDCYNNNGSCNNKMNGEFYNFKVGKNTLQVLGKISKIEVIPRWRCL